MHRQAAIAIDGFALGWIILWLVCALVGVVGLIGAAVVDKARLGITRCGVAADLGAGGGVAVTAVTFLVLDGAGTGRASRGGLVAGLGDAVAAQGGGRLMQHAIWADQGLFPGVLAGEARLADQAHGLGDELVEALDSHGDAAESQDSAVAHRDGERWGEMNTVQEQRVDEGVGGEVVAGWVADAGAGGKERTDAEHGATGTSTVPADGQYPSRASEHI